MGKLGWLYMIPDDHFFFILHVIVDLLGKYVKR